MNAEMTNSNAGELNIMDGTSAPSYCSFNPSDKAGKIRLYKAMTNSDKKLSDCINSTIDVVDVFMEMVNLVNKDTGEPVASPRIVLFDKEGTSYSCVSFGVMGALKRLFMVFGEPTWEDGIKLKVVQINSRDRKMLSLEAVL